MQRRTLLHRAVTAGAIGLTGCSSRTGDGDDPAPASSTATAGDRSPTTTAAEPFAITNRSVSTVGSDCRSDQEAGATIDVPGGAAVTFSGQIAESNPCYEVKLAGVTYDAGADRLDVALETVETRRSCTMCLGIIKFEGRVDFDGPSPSAVTVRKGDTMLAELDRTGGDGTASGAVEATDFGVVGQVSASDAPAVDVAFDSTGNRITVRGTIEADTPCQTAQLGQVAHDSETDTASITVETTRRPGTEDRACNQQAVGIAYQATAHFESSVPASATVVHDGQGVVTASHQ